MDLVLKKEYILLKKLIEVASQTMNSSSNIFLIIYPVTLMEN
jgi:hypothetical protein